MNLRTLPDIPGAELMEIVLKYYPFILAFEWDADRCHSELTLSNGNKSVQSDSDSWNKTVYSKNIISTETISRLNWEITMDRKGGTQVGLKKFGRMYMGIIDAKHIDSAKNGVSTGENHILLDINDKEEPGKFIDGAYDKMSADKVQWEKDDRVRLDFDCKEGVCNAFLNDQLLGKLTDDLPETFICAISLDSENTRMETTLFDFEIE